MGTSTFTDGVAVSGGFVTKPTTWVLEAGHRYLKGVVLELAPTGDEIKGITQADLTAAENYAWRTIITRLVGWYTVSGWSTSPPHPLFEIWDLLASSYVVAIAGQRKNIEDDAAIETQEKWLGQATQMLVDITDPKSEGQRTHLINPDGTVAHKRSNVAVPMVRSTTGVIFFPADKTQATSWGDTIKGSVEEFIDSHSIKTAY